MVVAVDVVAEVEAVEVALDVSVASEKYFVNLY